MDKQRTLTAKAGDVCIEVRMSADLRAQIADLPRMMTDVAQLAAALAGVELRRWTKAAAHSDPQIDGWAMLRPVVREVQEAFGAAFVAALVADDKDGQLARQVAQFPLKSELYEITETEIAAGNGRVLHALSRKRKAGGEQPVTINVGRGR